MTTLAVFLTFACFLVACFRARLAALALVPPCALIIARSLGLVDISSASHPLRWIVPVACAGLAGLAAWWYARDRTMWVLLQPKPNSYREAPQDALWAGIPARRNARALPASLLILASCAPDLLALHPFFWARFAEWPLVPLQIAICATITTALLAPERMVSKWLQ